MVVELNLPVEPRFTWPDERIDAVRGCVAVERGPLVLCVESTDLPEPQTIETLRVDSSHRPLAEGDGAIVRAVSILTTPGKPASLPYRSTPPSGERSAATTEVRLIPYHRWAQRGSAAMRVFLPTI